MSAFYDYSEPFSCECRAFGRLKEAGHEDLAVTCYGYMLLDEEHESVLHSRFPDVEFNGSIDLPGGDSERVRFLGRDSRMPPIRGIVKEYGTCVSEEEMPPELFAKMLKDVRKIQQLGIVRIDVATRQMIAGKFSDFSVAVTVPHFVTTPELNPGLTASMRASMQLQTFMLARDDYLDFDDMVLEWNNYHAAKKGAITIQAYPGGNGVPPLRSYELRNARARERAYTFVDPREYNWKKRPKNGVAKSRRRLRANPPGWVYYCGGSKSLTESLRSCWSTGHCLDWDYKDGQMYILSARRARPQPVGCGTVGLECKPRDS